MRPVEVAPGASAPLCPPLVTPLRMIDLDAVCMIDFHKLSPILSPRRDLVEMARNKSPVIIIIYVKHLKLQNICITVIIAL